MEDKQVEENYNMKTKEKYFKEIENYNVLSEEYEDKFNNFFTFELLQDYQLSNSHNLNGFLTEIREKSLNKIINVTKGIVKVYKTKTINLPICYFGHKIIIIEDAIVFKKLNDLFVFKFMDKNNHIIPTKYLDYSEYIYKEMQSNGDVIEKKDCFQVKIKKEYNTKEFTSIF